jgi:hypothetical protein
MKPEDHLSQRQKTDWQAEEMSEKAKRGVYNGKQIP